jgi:NAD(P) transhydrogenase subunit alpha
VIERNDVTIVGLTNLPATMPTHASQLLSRNVAAVLGLIVVDGALSLDWQDEIVAGACVTRKEAKV